MQPRFMPDLDNPADSLFAAETETDASVALIWSDTGTALTDIPAETTPTPALANQDTAFANSQNNLDNDIATPMPDKSAAGSTSHDIQDTAVPEDGSGPVPAAIFSAPVTSVPALAVLANPAAASAGSHVADVSPGNGGTFESLTHIDYPIFHAALTATAPLHGGGFATAAGAAVFHNGTLYGEFLNQNAG